MRVRFLWSLAILLACAGQAAAQEWTVEQQAVIDALSAGPVGIENDFERWEDGYHPDWSHWRLGNDRIRDRETHMQLVRDYIEGGAVVASFELEPVDVIVRGDTALARFNAKETLIEADGSRRVVNYSSATMLVREGDLWLVYASSISFTDTD